MPRTGHDRKTACSAPLLRHFNPRAPYGARQVKALYQRGNFNISIHVPRTGHDASPPTASTLNTHFNPRAPYGARRIYFDILCNYGHEISIHVPRTGHDLAGDHLAVVVSVISIHVPRTGHDRQRLSVRAGQVISIHVPRTGHDYLLNVST